MSKHCASNVALHLFQHLEAIVIASKAKQSHEALCLLFIVIPESTMSKHCARNVALHLFQDLQEKQRHALSEARSGIFKFFLD